MDFMLTAEYTEGLVKGIDTRWNCYMCRPSFLGLVQLENVFGVYFYVNIVNTFICLIKCTLVYYNRHLFNMKTHLYLY